ncbi:MAG TPA: matrixin family metalloprotease [Pyrinomonadaceae bacterium]|nr:matrixin family metalloprotease [Pyrinomonadaceae bacterium]
MSKLFRGFCLAVTLLALMLAAVEISGSRTTVAVAQSGTRYDDLADNAEFVLDGRKWNHTNLTYYFQNGTNDIAGNDEHQAVREAFTLWANVTTLTFTEVYSPSSADIVIIWAVGNHGDGFPFDGTNGVLAHAFFPPPNGGSLAGDAHFDDDETWSNNFSAIDMVTVAAHEIGHSLGLGHSQVPGALMYPFYNGPHRYLDQDDINGIRTLYPKALGYSLALNGSSAYFDVANSSSLNITGAITVEAAIKPNVAGADQAIIERYNNFGGGTSDGGYVLRLVGGKLAFVTLMNGAVFDYVIGSQDVSPGYWHHVAGVFDGSQLRVYLDGNLVGVKSSTFAPGTGTGNLRIGAKGDDLALKFNGLIDEARVSAAALYNANFNVAGVHELVPVASTRGYWKFDNQTVKDSSGYANHGFLVGGAGYSTDVP